MKTKITGYSNIKTLGDLQLQKQTIKRKLYIRKRLIDKHVDDFKEDFTSNYALRQALKILKINNPNTMVATSFLKDKLQNKNIFIPLIAGIGSAIGSFFLMRKFNKK